MHRSKSELQGLGFWVGHLFAPIHQYHNSTDLPGGIHILWLTPGWYGCNFKCVNFKHDFGFHILNIQIYITLEWTAEDHIDGKLTLVQITTWCNQATCHHWAHVDPDLCHNLRSQDHNELKWRNLTHLTLVPHICVSESGQHWFK